jgi:RNA polymerase sigma-70 factor (ECF subfamily)
MHGLIQMDGFEDEGAGVGGTRGEDRPLALAPGAGADSSDEERRARRDRRAVAALKRGEQDALHYLYVRYRSETISVVRGIVRDDYECEDIVQSVFTKLPRVIARYEPRDVPFAAWLARVARNAALDHLRSHRVVPVEEVRLADRGSRAIARDRLEALRAAMAELPRDQRMVIGMRHIAGMTPGEIAERLGKSEPAVHGLHHRGRLALRAKLVDLEAAPTTAA